MSVELKELYEDPSMGNSMKSLAYESIRPQMLTTEIRYVETSMIFHSKLLTLFCIYSKIIKLNLNVNAIFSTWKNKH